MSRHHPDLVMCRKQAGIAIGRLCDKCDGKCPVCDSYVRPTTLVRICDECSFGNYQNKCVVCGGEGISDAFYCHECTRLEKDRDGCPKIINLGSSRTDVSPPPQPPSLLRAMACCVVVGICVLTASRTVVLPKENESDVLAPLTPGLGCFRCTILHGRSGIFGILAFMVDQHHHLHKAWRLGDVSCEEKGCIRSALRGGRFDTVDHQTT